MKMSLLLTWIGFAVPLFAEQALPLDEYWRTDQPVPTGVKLTLRVPETVVIGHEMPAALVVRNEGAKPFEITPGGDYRTTGYPQRMKVRVHDADGKMLPELSKEAYGFGGGGISAPRSIAPGASDEVEFPLDCYVSFKKPGVYTVTAGHDLGWKVDPAVPHPVAKKSVQVVLPSEKEAVAYVEAVYARQPQPPPGDKPEALRSQWELEKTLSVLRHPVYLRVLVRHARAGSKAAVKGIGHIATPEATEALLELLGNASADVVETSCQQLLRRLPSPEDEGKPVERFYWGSPYQIEPLLPTSWEVRFEQPLLKAALKLLWHKSDAVVQCAGLLLQSRAQPENATQVLEVLQQVLSVRHEPSAGPKANTLEPPVPQGVLLGVLDGMRKRGWRLAGNGGHEAQQVAWLRQLADKDVPKPKGDDWKSSMLVYVEDGASAMLKVCALQAVPQPLSDAAAKAVQRALDDRDWRVQRVACEVAAESKRAEFRRPLAQIIELEHERNLQSTAFWAAKACGGGLELWEAWAAVITDQDCMCDAISSLMQGTLQLEADGGSNTSSDFSREQRFAIRDAWRAFLKRHAKELAAGKRVPPPDAETAAQLTGANLQAGLPAVRISLKDGSLWPPMAGK